MRFEKWQALGNDYVIVEREKFGIPLDQGYNPWSQQPVGDQPKAATRAVTYPAFTDMGGRTADVAPNADLCDRLGVTPITIYRGSLSMRPLKMTAAQKKLVPASIPGAAGKEYLSPAINTYPFAQKYGVRYTPTFQFFPDSTAGLKDKSPQDREVSRFQGYLQPPLFLAAFRFVAERAYERGSLRDYLRAN